MSSSKDEIVVSSGGSVTVKAVSTSREASVETPEGVVRVLVRRPTISFIQGPGGGSGGLPDISTAEEGDTIVFNGSDVVWAPNSHRHIQAVPSALWEIDHEIPYSPAVTVVDSAHRVVMGEVSYEPGKVLVEFFAPFSGEAFLS